MFPGYKSSFGMPRELLDQFPIVEDALRALGLVVWPMVEFEADDAIAAACSRFSADPAVEQVARLHARQGHGPARRRRAGRPPRPAPPDHLRRAGRAARSGACRRRRSRTGSRSSATRPTAIPASRAGARSPPRRCSPGTARSRRSRRGPPRGTSRACAAPPCSPPRSASAGTRSSCTARSRGCGRPTTASRSRSRPSTSCAGGARRARVGSVLRPMRACEPATRRTASRIRWRRTRRGALLSR